ncbi:MAG TPA: PilC/PilY family type IV pilus protein [Ramlibacter sp.]|uniref:pilus assembly protein n=1 Tax=Ramlibacter sp. TaxID=1917967 RepID=UPI002D7EECB5|nr:PilC/PilY family type IV pilus protein [Ramlibacter sp.]HET8748007.1 PilC/PilY family type IV pilus protein [Ramlibacter sp.]
MFNPLLRCDAAPAARTGRPARRALARALALGLSVSAPLGLLAATDLSSVPLPTFAVGSAVDIKPNILMVLDDSGSMNWDYLPDWANDRPGNYAANSSLGLGPLHPTRTSIDESQSLPSFLFRNAAFNGVAYNPAIRYQPPIGSTEAGGKDTSTYPSMTGVDSSTGASSAAKPNWRAVVYDGYGVQRESDGDRPLTDLEAEAFFYTVIPGEYCDSPALTNCTAASAPTGNFQYAAPLRWCNSTALTTCRSLPGGSYTRPRIPAPRTTTISFSNASNAVVTSIKVDNLEILSASTTSSSDSATVANRVRDAINACTLGKPSGSNCQVVGYFATSSSSSSTVRIYAPGTTSGTPAVNKSGTLSVSTGGAFARDSIPLPDWSNGTGRSTNPVPGENVLTVITRSIDSYPYPGSSTKAPGRTDCTSRADRTCSYQEEMTNYANWWAYYRTRMQMMKTSTSRAFSALDTDEDIAQTKSRYRVGYLTLNNNTGSDFVNIDTFAGSQKFTWYSKLFAARPNSGTPLRAALSTAGRLYAGVLNGDTVNGVRVREPLQFSCQRNYTILSTDGFWNGAGGVKLDGSTAMDNQDGPLPRPYNDGGQAQNQARTSQLQRRITTQTAEVGTLTRGTLQDQTRTSQLQKRTSDDKGKTWNRSGSTDDDGWFNTSSCTWDTSSNSRTECRYKDGAWTGAQSCTPVARSTGTRDGTTWNVSVARDCQADVVVSPFVSAASCTPTQPDSNGRHTGCQYSFGTAVATPTCEPQFVDGNFTNTTVYRNCRQMTGNPQNVASCTATSTPNDQGQMVTCGYSAWTGWSNVATCTAVPQSAGPTTFDVGVARECQLTSSGGTSNTLADIAAYYYNRDLRDPAATTGVDRTGSCEGPIVPPATTPSNLCTNNVQPFGRDASVKQHMTTHTLGLGAQGQMVYSNFQNDLSGQRVYQPDYWSQQSGDFFGVANGSIANPTSGICPWLSSGATCTWPTPAADSSANIDDLWHAAVNGHGTYFSAADPISLGDALTGVLSQINNPPRPGTAAAAASSNPNITSSDNFVFSSSYKSVEWFGELIMQNFNEDGSLTAQQWSAMQLLDCATTSWQANHAYKRHDAFKQGGVCYAVTADYTSGAAFDGGDSGNDGQNVVALPAGPVSRTIYTVGSVSGSPALVPFTWASLSGSQQGFFSKSSISFVDTTRGLTQFCTSGPTCMTGTAQDSAAGENLVNYLRGDRTYEGTYYRQRTHVLGDIVTAEARYVKQPMQDYLDAGFAQFKNNMASRAATVYVPANDGMLHAFDAVTGQERWAFIPSAVLPEIYRLADTEYANKHRYFVDGTPEVGEICPRAPTNACAASEWRTILVGGLNQGGKAYYALDITDPASPRLLWEFTHADLGFSYSNPRITKLRNGTWVVIVASGYNNTDGIGRLFVLNAATGAVINTISTGVGTAALPSGLAKIQARAPNASVDNTVEEVYGGDLLGNLWRFDVNDMFGTAGIDAHLLVQFKDPAGNAQSITSKPVVATVADKPLVIVGTGRYLGQGDLTDTNTYTMYAVKDKLDAATLTTPRVAGSNFVQQTLTEGECPQGTSTSICTPGQSVRTVTSNPVDWSVKNGWFIDFPLGGERSVTDATLALGTVVFTTIKPQPPATGLVVGCTGESTLVDAKSFLYYLDYLTGSAVQGTKNVAGEELCTCVATRPSVVKTQKGSVQGVIRMSGGGTPTEQTGGGTDMGVTNTQELPYNPAGQPPRRISWRELNSD